MIFTNSQRIGRWMTKGVARSAAARGRTQRWMALIGLILICTTFLLPFAWMVSTSLKTLEKTMAFPPDFLPRPVMPGNYWRVLTHDKVDFPLYTRNTLVIAALTVVGTTLSSSMAAYAFAKVKFLGRG